MRGRGITKNLLRRGRWTIAAAGITLLAACSGGGGDGDGVSVADYPVVADASWDFGHTVGRGMRYQPAPFDDGREPRAFTGVATIDDYASLPAGTAVQWTLRENGDKVLMTGVVAPDAVAAGETGIVVFGAPFLIDRDAEAVVSAELVSGVESPTIIPNPASDAVAVLGERTSSAPGSLVLDLAGTNVAVGGARFLCVVRGPAGQLTGGVYAEVFENELTPLNPERASTQILDGDIMASQVEHAVVCGYAGSA